MVAHHVISKASGDCWPLCLLNERKQSAESAKHVAAIREIAEWTIKELIEHQRTIRAEKRKAG